MNTYLHRLLASHSYFDFEAFQKDPSGEMTELQAQGVIEDYVQKAAVERCNEPSGFFSFPSWHEYLFKRPDYVITHEPRHPNRLVESLANFANDFPGVNIDRTRNAYFTGDCTPVIDNINDVWHVALAVLEMLMRASVLLALVFIIYSGFSYMLSQGRPDKIEKAKKTLLYAVIGFAFSAAATFIVTFAAGLVS